MAANHSREWYEARLEGFASTDAAPILGLSRWRTGRDVVEEKMRQIIPDPDVEQRYRFRIGQELEPILIRHAGELARERGLIAPQDRVTHSKRERPFVAKGFGFIQAHTDGFAGSAMVEIKTDAFGYEAWGDEDGDPSRAVPPFYYAQVQHGLAATGRPRALLYVLIGLSDRKLFEIPRDDDFIADLVETFEPIWADVLEGRARLEKDPDAEIEDLLPELDGSAASTAWLKKRYPRDDDEIILPASAEQEQLIAELRDSVRSEAALKIHVAALKNRLRDVIGLHAGISSALGTITWRKSKDSDVVEHEPIAAAYRQLLMKTWEAEGEHVFDVALDAAGFHRETLPVALDTIVSLHSGTKEGSRTFLTPRSWTKESAED